MIQRVTSVSPALNPDLSDAGRSALRPYDRLMPLA
jgi:hypothetical protein